jgi:hypothetical protein
VKIYVIGVNEASAKRSHMITTLRRKASLSCFSQLQQSYTLRIEIVQRAVALMIFNRLRCDQLVS